MDEGICSGLFSGISGGKACYCWKLSKWHREYNHDTEDIRQSLETRSMQEALLNATLVARNGKPDPQSLTDWVNIRALNSSTETEDRASSCYGIPSHQHIQIWSRVAGTINGVPQRDIVALHVSYSLSEWALDCRGSDVAPCQYPLRTHMFPVTSSVTFVDIPVSTGPPKTRFQINFTEYDCDRNDVCWPELAFPLTRYYTGGNLFLICLIF
ncbi:unnamed protein product [Tetraodon nigroviridis]|uniref:(spotted green pufferfish) hypothetical protein n=1 Tax=Tetraodon nigroviridis TaxID=99883 RepID=Q4RSZ2_TETNG|nr:unnamed protein product [Tetraodon nigroviridis]